MLLALLPVVMLLSQPAQSVGLRAALLKHAQAHWTLGEESAAFNPLPLTTQGQIERPLPPEGSGANTSGGKAARLTNAYFDAGKNWTLSSAAITVYLRARDPRGLWSYGLFSKRGSHETCAFNLFSVTLSAARGPESGLKSIPRPAWARPCSPSRASRPLLGTISLLFMTGGLSRCTATAN